MQLGNLLVLQCNFQFQNLKVLLCNFQLMLPMPILKTDRLHKMVRQFFQVNWKYKQSARFSFHGSRDHSPVHSLNAKDIDVKYFFENQ